MTKHTAVIINFDECVFLFVCTFCGSALCDGRVGKLMSCNHFSHEPADYTFVFSEGMKENIYVRL